MTLATWITLSRIFLIPVIMAAYHTQHFHFVVLLFSWIIVSDFLDGKVARLLNHVTPLGSLLDPIADKAVILSFIAFLYQQAAIAGWFLGLIFLRNLAQLVSIPILKAWLKIDFKVKPALPAKYATAISFLIIFFFLLGKSFPFFHGMPTDVAFSSGVTWVLLPISAVLEFYVLVTYLPRFYLIATRQHDTFE